MEKGTYKLAKGRVRGDMCISEVQKVVKTDGYNL